MDWSVLAHAVQDVAPILGSVLAGPAGSVAGRLIGAAVGKVTGTPEDIAKTITGGSFSDVLKELEANHSGWLTYFSNMRPISKVSLTVEFSS